MVILLFLIVGAAAQINVRGGYIAAPGGYECPTNCKELRTPNQCREGAQELGLPCGDLVSRGYWKPGWHVGKESLDTFEQKLGMRLHGAVVASTYDGTPGLGTFAVGTTLVKLEWTDSTGQLVSFEVGNRTDTATAAVVEAYTKAPVGNFLVYFSGACEPVWSW
eukprot:Hpha_TRINITY_DN16043_c1_g4::TRINITY_DN16043_c1_g4_i1::g.119263::m.119263